MTVRSVLEIKPHRYGWTCANCAADERVFVLKSQAIRYAQQQFPSAAGEIRIWDHNGSFERRLVDNPTPQAMSA